MTYFTNIPSSTRLRAGDSAVTVGKSRVKLYNINEAFLKNETEFEIELFNPNKQDLIATVSIEGEDMGSFVVRPGQRIFLERSSLSNKRFKFVHYEADNSKAGIEAIKDNGTICIDWCEAIPQPVSIRANPLNLINNYGLNTVSIPNNWNTIQYNSGTPFYGYSTNTANISSMSNCTFTSNTNGVINSSFGASNEQNTITTGKVEQGSISDQKFSTSSLEKGAYLASNSYKLLPLTEKIVEANEIRVYCTECGVKVKNNWKFCPKCGNKVE